MSVLLSALLLIAVGQPSPAVVRDLLTERALVHRANVSEVLAIADCETGGTFSVSRVGSMGERGVGQWLPGRGNHWDRTPGWRMHHYDVVAAYQDGDPEAWEWDVDGLAWSFGDQAEALYPGNRRGWSCWS